MANSPTTATTMVTLRRWQRDALIAFADRPVDSFLAVACPGAGKTTFALAAIRAELAGEHRPVVVTVPTAHLKYQWAHAASSFGVHLDPDWDPQFGLGQDMHGVVVTYAQAASASRQLRSLAEGGVVVLDEIHHAASDRSWGDGVVTAFELATVRLLLSGTPFRSDDNPIPFVRYTLGDHGEAVADFTYGYGDALLDGGVVRPVYFPRFDGQMEWISATGEHMEATFGDQLVSTDWSARLRTALDAQGNWLPVILGKAAARLTSIREQHPDAAGLVIATDHEHARAIVSLIRSIDGEEAKLILSDDPQASEKIAEFARSDARWIVAVRMISEGVDVPRMRVAVYATTTTTALFFRQAVGRIARWIPGLATQPAYFFVPDDHRLRNHAAAIAVERRHSIDKRSESTENEPELAVGLEASEQMSLFAALSARVVDEIDDVGDDGIEPGEMPLVARGADLVGHPFALPPPPPLSGRSITDGVPEELADLRSRFSSKRELRDRNADRAKTLARLLGWEHRAVNGELNRRSGVHRIAEATASELSARIEAADAWLDELSG